MVRRSEPSLVALLQDKQFVKVVECWQVNLFDRVGRTIARDEGLDRPINNRSVTTLKENTLTLVTSCKMVSS